MTYTESNRLHIFESPIDAMSHATIYCINKNDKNAWRNQNRLSLAGISDKALLHYLETHPNVEELIFHLDNDEAGKSATEEKVRKYEKMGFKTFDEPPRGKDLNDDLLALTEQKKAVKRTQMHHYDIGI